MRKVLRIGSKRKPKTTKQEKALSCDLNTRVEMIQALIPIGLMAVAEQLKEEVKQLTGERYSRQGGLPGHHRWGSQPRSIYLSDQKMRIDVTRVRNSVKNEEVPFNTCPRHYKVLGKPMRGFSGGFYWVFHVATMNRALKRSQRLSGCPARRYPVGLSRPPQKTRES